MTEFEVRSPKHGTGCTVVSALLAIAHARDEKHVLLVDTWNTGDMPGVLGMAEFTHRGVVVPCQMVTTRHKFDVTANMVYAAGAADDYDVIVWDVGFRDEWEVKPDAKQVHVVRNDYIVLRRWVHNPPTHVDMLVLVEEPGRALAVADVEGVTGRTVTHCLPFDPSIARAVDAGLLVSGYRATNHFANLRRTDDRQST